MLIRKVISLNTGNFIKKCVKSRNQDSTYKSFKHVSEISDNNLST